MFWRAKKQYSKLWTAISQGSIKQLSEQNQEDEGIYRSPAAPRPWGFVYVSHIHSFCFATKEAGMDLISSLILLPICVWVAMLATGILKYSPWAKVNLPWLRITLFFFFFLHQCLQGILSFRWDQPVCQILHYGLYILLNHREFRDDESHWCKSFKFTNVISK